MTERSRILQHWIDQITAYLPHQAPLQDFIHHNPLSAFHDLGFHKANSHFAKVYGAKTFLSLEDYREAYQRGEISEASLQWAWTQSSQLHPFETLFSAQVKAEPKVLGSARYSFQRKTKIDLDHWVYPKLFRILSHATDQGVALVWLWDQELSFLENLQRMNQQTGGGLFYKGTKGLGTQLLMSQEPLPQILDRLVEPSLQKAYLFDQVLSHPGWSGMLAQFEHDQGASRRRSVRVSLEEMVIFECLLEIDALEKFLGTWEPLKPSDLSTEARAQLLDAKYPNFQLNDSTNFLLQVWQEAKEREVHYQAMCSVAEGVETPVSGDRRGSFQAIFCIDDREESLRRHLESLASSVTTYSTAGFFGVEFLYQSDAHRYPTKLCPAPVSPQYLVRGRGDQKFHKSDHLSSLAENPLTGPFWVPALGFSLGVKLMLSLFRPRFDLARTGAFQQAHADVELLYAAQAKAKTSGLKEGFLPAEMADRVAATLKSIGLDREWGSLVYVIGHGASSTNNPYFAAYDCGACSGRPGSVNARIFCEMANRPDVRALLQEKGVEVPASTVFVAGLHDTTTDQVRFFDSHLKDPESLKRHKEFIDLMQEALKLNAVERSRKLPSPERELPTDRALERVQQRSENLFETRPELNHANNCLCVVGPRGYSEGIFFDRRAFLNSYDSEKDPEGRILEGILSAVFPVCGGINLEYYYSKVDNQKMGSASKLPHNIVGLIGVANGVEGDLRTGLPLQMIEYHEPLRLMVLVIARTEQVEAVLKRRPDLQSWVDLGWVLLSVCEPGTGALFDRRGGGFISVPRQEASRLRLPRQMQALGSGNLPISLVEEIYDN